MIPGGEISGDLHEQLCYRNVWHRIRLKRPRIRLKSNWLHSISERSFSFFFFFFFFVSFCFLMYDYNRMSRKRPKRLNRIRIKKKYTVCISFSISFLFVVVKKVIFRSQSGNLSFFKVDLYDLVIFDHFWPSDWRGNRDEFWSNSGNSR